MAPSRSRTRLVVGAAAGTLVLLGGLVACEGALRARFGSSEPVVERAGDGLRVLCVGDSTTLGGPLSRAETYPAYLEQHMRTRRGPPSVEVINLGACELSSRQLRDQLPGTLDRYQPDAVVVMIGAANLFNPWDLSLDEPGAWTWLRDLLDSSRLRGLLQAVNLRLEGQVDHLDGETLAGLLADPVSPTWVDERAMPSRVVRSKRWFEGFSRGQVGVLLPNDTKDPHVWITDHPQETRQLLEQALLVTPGDESIICAKVHLLLEAGEIEPARRIVDDLLAQGPPSEIAMNTASMLVVFEGRWLFARGRHQEAIEVNLEAIAFDPGEYHHYYWLAKSLQYQERTSPADIADRLAAMAVDDPELGRVPTFQRYLRMFQAGDALEPAVRARLMRDLEAIAAIARARDVTLVVQTYPYPYPMANQSLRTLAQQHGLWLVDQEPVFETMVSSPNRDAYVLDDDHLTAAGNRQLADSLWDQLEAGGFVEHLAARHRSDERSR